MAHCRDDVRRFSTRPPATRSPAMSDGGRRRRDRRPRRRGRRAVPVAARRAARSRRPVHPRPRPPAVARRRVRRRDDRRERQAAGRVARRVRAVGGVLPLVHRADRPSARHVGAGVARRLPRDHHPPARRARPADHAVELPDVDDRPQGRRRPGRRMPGDRQVRQGNAAHVCPVRRNPARGRLSRRRGQPRPHHRTRPRCRRP